MLKPLFSANGIDFDMTCYTHGSGPDTILNFGWKREPLYMEINYSGKLNLKISLDTSESEDARREIVKQEIRKCEQLSFGAPPTFHPGGKIGGSKTIASFDVGLFNKAGDLECQPSIEVTKQKLLPIIGAFYGRSATA